MFEAIEEPLVSWFGPQLLLYFFFLGYLILIICFYGGGKWQEFSDFDKIGFSFLTGFATWFLVIQPLSLYLQFIWNTFISFSNESYISAPPSSQHWFSLIILSTWIVLFFLGLRTLNKNKPFSGFDEVIERISKILIGFWIISIFSQLFFYSALRMTIYSMYSDYLLGMSIFNFLFLFLFIAFLGLTDKLDVIFEKVKGMIHSNYNRRLFFCHNRRLLFCLVVVLVLFIVGIPVTGLLLLNPSIQDHGEIISSIRAADSILDISYRVDDGYFLAPNEIFCEEYASKDYTINTKMLSWVRVPIEPNFTVTSAKGRINKSTSKDYEIYETYFIVNESRYQEINVTVEGYRNITLIKDEDYVFEAEGRKFGNQTEINITIINKMAHPLRLNKMEIYTPIPYNLTDWGPKHGGIDGVYEKTSNIKRMFVNLEGNQSSKVTLFLEEIEINSTVNSSDQNGH